MQIVFQTLSVNKTRKLVSCVQGIAKIAVHMYQFFPFFFYKCNTCKRILQTFNQSVTLQNKYKNNIKVNKKQTN